MNMEKWQFAASVIVVGAALSGGAALAQTSGLMIEILSSRPELVTGSDALVKVSGGDTAPTVSVDGRDVSASFKTDPKGGWVGLIKELKQGDNVVTAKAAGKQATLT